MICAKNTECPWIRSDVWRYNLNHYDVLCPFKEHYGANGRITHQNSEESRMVSRLKKHEYWRINTKTTSIMFNHEPCLGVNTNSKRPGSLFKYSCVSFDVCAEWLLPFTCVIRRSKPCLILRSTPNISLKNAEQWQFTYSCGLLFHWKRPCEASAPNQ